MEKKHIDKIAVGSSPDRREGEPNPRGVGAELPPAHSASLPSSPQATPGSSLTGMSQPPSPEESAFFERNRLRNHCRALRHRTGANRCTGCQNRQSEKKRNQFFHNNTSYKQFFSV